MIAYYCIGPEGTRLARVRLRLVVYAPEQLPTDGRLKCVLQAMRGWIPVAEDPLAEDHLTPQELEQVMEASRREGWNIQQDQVLEALLKKMRPPRKNGVGIAA